MAKKNLSASEVRALDPRIGRRGSDPVRPSRTIGNAIPEPSNPRRGIGGGYYIVEDIFPRVDAKAETESLQSTLGIRHNPVTPVTERSANERPASDS